MKGQPEVNSWVNRTHSQFLKSQPVNLPREMIWLTRTTPLPPWLVLHACERPA